MAISCDAPTPHFASGCALLLAVDVDTDNDGIISNEDVSKAKEAYEKGWITKEEFDFVSDAYIIGDINVVCPRCWEAPPKKIVTFTSVPAGAEVTIVD